MSKEFDILGSVEKRRKCSEELCAWSILCHEDRSLLERVDKKLNKVLRLLK